MNVFDPNPAEILPLEALQMIFNHLDAKDLVNCEAVCQKWRTAISQGTPWKQAFFKQVNTSPLWLEVWKNMSTADIKDAKADIYKYMFINVNNFTRDIDTNWRTGNYSFHVHALDADLDWDHFTLGSDYAACVHSMTGAVQYFDPQCLTVTRSVPMKLHSITKIRNDFIMVADEQKLKFFDSTSGRLIGEFFNDPEWEFSTCCLHSDLLATMADRGIHGEALQLTIWAFKSPSEIKQLKQWTFEGSSDTLNADEHYITAQTVVPGGYKNRSREVTTVYFISTKTVEIERSVSFQGKTLHYGQGLLLVADYSDYIRVLHVATGTYFHNLNLQFLSLRRIPDNTATFNSNYLAIVINSHESSKLHIYDIKSRDPTVDPNIPLLNILQIPFTIVRMWLDETRLMCIEDESLDETTDILVFDFGLIPMLATELLAHVVSFQTKGAEEPLSEDSMESLDGKMSQQTGP